MKVAVLCSGGVDSSVALSILKKRKIEVVAVYLKIWMEDDLDSLAQCPWQEDISYLGETCEQLQVEMRILSLQREYYETIIKDLFEHLRNGLTSNPDLYCNHKIKFGVVLEKLGSEFTHIASGHYARIEKKTHDHEQAFYVLKKGKDNVKDQSYFLSHLNQDQLKRILFPLGSLQKKTVREIAKKERLPAFQRKDSQGLCFIGKINFRKFIQKTMGEKSGAIIDWDSQEQIGEHQGHWFYTIGQRNGLRLANGPYYVVARNHQKNIIYVSHNPCQDSVNPKSFIVKNGHWITRIPPQASKLQVRIRHGKKIIDCQMNKISQFSNDYRVELDEKDSGISSGQIAVFYRHDECLGGGVISELPKKKPDKSSRPLSKVS